MDKLPDWFLPLCGVIGFLALVVLGVFGIMAAAEHEKRVVKELEARGCKIIWTEPSRYEYGYHDGKSVSVHVSGFKLWQCPGEPIFKR